MHHTVLIFMVKTSIPGCCHFEFKLTLVFLDFLKTISDGNWNLKVHENPHFMNDQLLCGKCQPIYTDATRCSILC